MIASSVALTLLAVAILTAAPPLGNRLMRTPSQGFIAGRAVTAAAAALAVIGTALVSPALAIAAALLGATATRRYWRRSRAVQRRRERRLIAAALEILVGELRAGAHPVDAFTAAAAESDGTVAGILLTVASRTRLGADVSAGLREAARMSTAPESWDRVAVCWDLAAEHGLAMATIVDAAQHDIVSRQRFSDTIHAGLSGARATAAILAAMPVIGVLLGGLIGAHPLSFLLGGPLGAALLMVGVALMCAGVIWSDHIIDRVMP